MESLKRFYLNFVAAFTNNREGLRQTEDSITASTRVSREVHYYRTHFFNL